MKKKKFWLYNKVLSLDFVPRLTCSISFSENDANNKDGHNNKESKSQMNPLLSEFRFYIRLNKSKISMKEAFEMARRVSDNDDFKELKRIFNQYL